MEFFITKLFQEPAYYLSVVATFAGSICVHEYCHAFVAHHLGDDTAKEGGFMTLNPLKVMGWMSIAALLLFGFSWGAVPVKREDPSRLRRSAISLAGPLSNFVLLGIMAMFLKGLYVVATPSVAGGFINYCHLFLICALYANAVLFLFNILPIPTLDGWGIIEPFLPKFLIPSDKTKHSIFMGFIYLVCFSSASGLLDTAVESLTSKFLPRQVNAMTLVTEGEKYLEEKDYPGAYKAFADAAEQGVPAGKMYLAFCLTEGCGCEVNHEKAFSLFSEKDVCVFPLAKYYLGIMWMNGLGCSQDYAKAYDYLSQKDIQQEFPLARANLGLLFANGFGVKQDASKAFALLNDEEVMKEAPMARFYVAVYLMEGEVCPKDEKRAFSLLNDEQVFNAHPAAQSMLGMCYYAGTGTKQDFAKAAQHLKAAAEAGDHNAEQFLGYQNGKMPDYGISLEELLRRHWNLNK